MSEPTTSTRLVIAAPTVADLRAGVLRAARGDETVWAAVCESARALPWSGTDHDVRDRLLRAAKDRGGAVSVAALAYEVRLRTHRNLTALQAARTS
jgi:hypothetical protein